MIPKNAITKRLEGLGLCEHCAALLSMEDMSADAMNADWYCPKCNGILTHVSFGYRDSSGGKAKWVGPKGKWVEQRPIEDFLLGDWYVLTFQYT